MITGTTNGVFRSIANAQWGVQSGGDVEAPCGFFTVVQIPEHAGERAEMREAVFEDPDEVVIFDGLAAGWYFVVQDSDGGVAHTRCEDEKDAFSCFRRSEETYSEWTGEEI